MENNGQQTKIYFMLTTVAFKTAVIFFSAHPQIINIPKLSTGYQSPKKPFCRKMISYRSANGYDLKVIEFV